MPLKTISHFLDLDKPGIWSVERAFVHLKAMGKAATKRTAERRLNELAFLPKPLDTADLLDEMGRPAIRLVANWQVEQSRRHRSLVLFAQLHPFSGGKECIHLNDARGTRYWIPTGKQSISKEELLSALQRAQEFIGKEIFVIPHGRLVSSFRGAFDSSKHLRISTLCYLSLIHVESGTSRKPDAKSSPHLRRLEAEGIHIIREAVSEGINPVMLYSIGKDSSVMLHLARKAFYPAPPPFPLLHVDTRWKFQEMYLFRDTVARKVGVDLLIHVNPEAIEKNINPFDHGSALHTTITKTEGLKQALEKYKFDIAFGGARRDEEKSRAKERIFSFRSVSNQWDPKNQRPELWNLYNTRKGLGESIRVFPLSNWTELDIWLYILQENIPVVPLYFAKERPVVVRDNMILLIDDDRMRLLPGEQIEVKKIRFRTLGCYPLTGAIESSAGTVSEIVLELLAARSSERQGRAIDSDSSSSMEKKKREGYF